MKTFQLIILSLFAILVHQSNAQVHHQYDRGNRIGFDDNKWVVKLLHDKDIHDCSCEGIFNHINTENLVELENCLRSEANFLCPMLYLKDDLYNFGLKTQTLKLTILPYDFALLLKKEKVLELLDQSDVWSEANRQEHLRTLYEYMTDARISREEVEVDSLNAFLSYLGNRPLFENINDKLEAKYFVNVGSQKQVKDVLNASIKLNIPQVYEYFLTNYSCVDTVISNSKNNTSRFYFLKSITSNHYPTIDLFEFFLAHKILFESDLKTLVDDKSSLWNESKNKNRKTLLKYYKNYFLVQELGTDSKASKKLLKQMDVCRTNLNKWNALYKR